SVASSRGSPPYAVRKTSGSAGGPGSVTAVPARRASSTVRTRPSRWTCFMQSIPYPPSGGTRAALRTTLTTRSPRPETTPGTTSPPDEWATRTIDLSSCASSMSSSTEATSWDTVRVARSAGRPVLPGRFTANVGPSRYGTNRSQKRDVDPPQCTNTYVIAEAPARRGRYNERRNQEPQAPYVE